MLNIASSPTPSLANASSPLLIRQNTILQQCYEEGEIIDKQIALRTELSQLHRCSFVPTSNKNDAGNEHTFTAAECGGLDFQNEKCAVALKATSAMGGDEDWIASQKPPKVTWWIRGNAAPGGRIEVEYLCPAAGSKLSDEWGITTCYAKLPKGGEASKSHTFTDTECGGKKPANVQNCYAAVSQRSQSGSDEDWALQSGAKSLTFTW